MHRGTLVEENFGVGAELWRDGDVAFLHLPQIGDNVGLTESARALRCLPRGVQVLLLTANTNAAETALVNDILNVTGVNTLRGENISEFGERFPDLSRLRIPGKLESLPFAVPMLLLDQRAGAPVASESRRVSVYGGCLQNILTLAH